MVHDFIVDKGDRGIYHKNNQINELTSKEWLKFTRTWFVHNPPPRRKSEKLHPAKYPESMVKEFIEFFTKKNDVVVDPFLGTGSTLIASAESQRIGIGIELLKKYAEISKQRISNLQSQKKLVKDNTSTKQTIILGNSLNIDKIWESKELPKADFVITSPPYFNMLNKKGIIQDKRTEDELDTTYSDEKKDIGNVTDYKTFVKKLVTVFKKFKPYINKNKYLVVVLQNFTNKGNWMPLAWDFGKGMSKHFTLKGEKIWCQNNKILYPYGYRFSFVPNVHHHYCLIFKKK